MSDTFIVNDNDEAGNVTTKVISAPNLAADLGARININELAGVSLDSPEIGNVIKWNGTAWVPAQDLTGEGGAGIALTDLNAVTASTGVGAGSLTYNNLQGIFTYTPPLLTLENMDNVSDQVPTTGQFLRWSGTYWYPSSSDNSFTVVNLDVGSGLGSLDLTDTTFTYTPPDLSNFLTAEADPVFSASAAASISYEDIANWNSLLIDLGQDTLNDLADVSTNGFTPSDGMVLTYDSATGIWYPRAVPSGTMGDLDDVYTQGAAQNDILVYDGAQWRAQPNPSREIEAGPGLYGGGVGSVVLGVNVGRGITINSDFVELDAKIEDLKNVSALTAQDGYLLQFQQNFWVPVAPGELGPRYLGDLLDVSTDQQGQNKVLTYYNNMWVARDVDVAQTLGDLTDVTTRNVQDGQYLKYENGTWQPGGEPVTVDEANRLYIGNQNSTEVAQHLIFCEGTFASYKEVWEDNKLKYYPGPNVLQLIDGEFAVYDGDPFEAIVQSGTRNGVEIKNNGVIEMVRTQEDAHIDFKSENNNYDWRISQAENDRFYIQYKDNDTDPDTLYKYIEIDHANQLIRLGDNCGAKKADVRINGNLSVCGSIEVGDENTTGVLTTRHWGHINKVNASNNQFTTEGDSGNFTINTERNVTGGFGRVKIIFDTPAPTRYYITQVTTIDGEGDHMAGVIEQTESYVIIYAKDLQNYADANGSTDAQDVSSMMFTVSY